MRGWPLILVLVAACAVPTPTPARPVTLPATPTAPTAPVAPTTAPPAPTIRPATPIPASIATRAPPRVPPSPATDPNRGIVFGKPAALVSGDRRTVAVLVTNTSDLVKSLTVRAVYAEGDRVVATAVGAVSDLPPRQQRAVRLAGADPIPATARTVRVEVGTFVEEQPTTSRARAAGMIRFGPIRVVPRPTRPTVQVEVTNGDAAPHGLVVQAAFVRGEEIRGVAYGAVTDVAPNQVKLADLLLEGEAEGHDRVVLAVETVVE